jgi:nucleoside-diphosphate-sugar epimerase
LALIRHAVNGSALVIGCGYVGLPLALELKKRFTVSAWVHSQATAASLAPHRFARVLIGSVADKGIWEGVDLACDLVIHCASSGRGGEAAYEEVFVQGARRIGEHLPRARKLFVSSTSVYGQNGGEMVTEDSPAEPSTATGKLLREAEVIALGSGTTVVRSSGIYGPGRGVLFDKFRRGEAVIEGDGSRWINQIHRDDLVSAIAHLIDRGDLQKIYNATDNTPVMQRDYYAWCAEYLKKPLPPCGPVNTQRKRGLTNKRVLNGKLRTTGWEPLYPSFREGIAAIEATLG